MWSGVELQLKGSEMGNYGLHIQLIARFKLKANYSTRESFVAEFFPIRGCDRLLLRKLIGTSFPMLSSHSPFLLLLSLFLSKEVSHLLFFIRCLKCHIFYQNNVVYVITLVLLKYTSKEQRMHQLKYN